MMFNRWDFHLKNPDPLPVLEPPMAFLHQVRMPLLMVIAGIATAIALERRTVAGFALDRIQRLFVPLVFGMLVIVPPQIYIEASERIALRGYPETHRLIGDWDTIAYYALLFASGHLLGRSPAVWDHLVARRWRYLAALGARLAVMLPPNEYPFPFEPWPRFAAVLISSLAATWILCEAVARVRWLRPLCGLPAARRSVVGPAVPVRVG